MGIILIIGFSISTFILIGTLIFIRIFYSKRKKMYEDSKKADEKLERIDFDKHKKYFK